MPDIDTLPESRRTQFALRKKAVELWLAGRSAKEIYRTSRLNATVTRRLVERCVSVNPLTQDIYGYWRCDPGYRPPAQTRQRVIKFDQQQTSMGRGLTGALGDLFRRHPGIKKALTTFVTTRRISGDIQVNQIKPMKVHLYFLNLCRREGVEQTEWPFNTKQQGYKAINAWYQKMRIQNPVASANNEEGKDEAALVGSQFQQMGWARSRGVRLAYERTELDEHYFDGMFEIGFPMSAQHIESISTRRLWILAMTETRTGAALSSSVAYGERYNRNDVLKLIRRALIPPPRYQLTLRDPEFRYAEGAAYPGELPDFEFNVWQTLAFDSDAAHLSAQTLGSIETAVGCSILNERVGHARARPNIEGLFKYLAEAASWLPSATGNRPDSPLRRSPEHQAVRHHIQAHLAEELVDVFFRNHNLTPNAANGGLSPLFMLNELLQRGEVFKLGAGELSTQRLWALLPSYPAKLNRVSPKTRLGPFYVELFGARYSSPELATAQELVLQDDWNVRVYVEEDARFAFVVPLSNSARVFKVAIAGKHAETPHSLEWRRAYDAFTRTQKMRARGTLPITMVGFARGLAELGKEDNKAAALLGDVMSFMTRHNRGEVPLVGFADGEDQRMLEAVHETVLEDDDEGELPSVVGMPEARSGGIIFGP
jgi:hypothetical protein